MKFKSTLLFLIAFFAISNSWATHLMGGEITWKCLSSGQYRFQMKIYKDCNGFYPVQASNISFDLDVTNHPTLTTVPMHIVDSVEISPRCNIQGPAISCATVLPPPALPQPGATYEFVFESNPITISGVPPAAGWVFSWGKNCCRNAAIQNLNNPATRGITLRAIMYPYNGQNTNPCFDSSPAFAERPAIAICAGYPFQYNHNASDDELDSLSFSWSQPLTDYSGSSYPSAQPFPINTASGFSVSSPFPGPTLNPANVPAVLDPVSGQVAFTSYTTGNFVTVIKVSAFKCGQLVAEVFRDIQVILIPCGTNEPPLFYPPFANATSYDTTVVAGTVLDFKLLAVDSGWDPSGAFHQYLSFSATGQQFDPGFTNPAGGCLNPPCATLTPSPFPVTQLRDSIYFHWETSCNHLNYGNQGVGPCLNPVTSNRYTFVVIAQDDYCPAPALSISTFTINVLGLPLAESPKIRCASVLPNGDVQLSWIPGADPAGTFGDYMIYTSTTPAGPFTRLDSSVTNIATNSWTHVGANAGVQPRYYFIRTRSGCYGKVESYPTDTLQAIQLNVTNPGTGSAALTWNALHTPALPSSDGLYHIYRKVNSGAWTLIDSTLNTSYNDPIFKCQDTVFYRVELNDSMPCTSVSTVDSDVFFDNTPPSVPIVDSVTVDPITNLMHIGWEVSPDLDTRGYIIFYSVGLANTYLDTVFGRTNTFYTTAFTNAKIDSFRVVAYDSCANNSPFGLVHRTIRLNAQLNNCLQGAQLSWNTYVNWPSGVQLYNIYASENGGPSVFVGSTSATTYFHAPINVSSTYVYTVKAVSSSGAETSSSQPATLVAYVIQLPRFLYVRTATVEGDTRVRIDCHVDTAADIAEYKIMRAYELAGPYDTIATIPASNSPLISAFDSVDTSLRSYYYKASAVDICSERHLSDNYGKTILLTAKSNDDLTNTIYWSDYEDWSGGVQKYAIYRNYSGVWDTAPVSEVNAGTNTFTDDISGFITEDGNFCYYVKALEEGGLNAYGFSDTSLSNIACTTQGPRLYTPNAFSPGGKNPVFYPINAFIELTSYHFVVFNRWGEAIFESFDPKAGWDGTVDGQEAPVGVYVYLLSMDGTNQRHIERKGTISLIR